MKTVVLKFGAFFNTGYTPEEWAALTDDQRDAEIDQALWNDINVWTEEQEAEDQ